MPSELYRRFRPKTFAEIVGQQEAVRVLMEKVKSRSVPHALLLAGPSGVGKTTIARILRRELGCGKNDYQELDVGDNRGIDTARQLKRTISLAPMSGKCRIVLLDEVHRSTSDFQSAILKLLEDCPAHVYFILATTEPDGLLPTIRTRCTHLALKPLSESDLRVLVGMTLKKTGYPNWEKTSGAVVNKIVEVSEGSARKALVLLEKVIGLKDEREQLDAIESEGVKKSAESIAKLLMSRAKWPEVSACLKSLEGEDAERIRRMILGYARAVLLSGNGKGSRAYFILDAFDGSLFHSGHPGLARCCFYAAELMGREK